MVTDQQILLFSVKASPLSAALAAQTSVAANMSEYITTKQRESYLAHALFTLLDGLKRELLVAPGMDSQLLPWLPCPKPHLRTSRKVVLPGSPLLWRPLVRAPLASASVLLHHLVGARSGVVAAGVRLLPQLRARVFCGRSHSPVQPL